jgi:hypothetical protein
VPFLDERLDDATEGEGRREPVRVEQDQAGGGGDHGLPGPGVGVAAREPSDEGSQAFGSQLTPSFDPRDGHR